MQLRCLRGTPQAAAVTTERGDEHLTEKEKTQGFSIKDKSACIIGCGGLGCNIAVHLVGAGIGKLILCDFDKVCQSNLNRQFLYIKEDIGKSKCQKAKERLSLYSNDTVLQCIERKIKKTDDMSFAKDCDIILLAVDNSEARKVVQSFAVKEGIPLVCGGIDGFYGMSYLFIPYISPCPDCAGLNEVSKAKHSVSSTAGIIGSAQAALAVRYLTTKNNKLSGKILIYDEGSFDTLKIAPSENCSVCKNIE